MAFLQGVKDFLGIGRGKIDIQLKKYSYILGEIVEGTIILSLNKPVDAQGLSIQMICNQITTKWNPQTRHNDELTVSLLDFTQPIDNAKTYPAGNTTYPFQIKIPANILDKPKIPDGFAGTLVRTAEALNHTPVTIQWWLIARLSVKGIDTVKQINILVG